jgi:signal-transduction protein with cAMP-binding, CBS, and nucleotidyltransferase domain
MIISECMSSPVISVSPDMTLQSASKKMSDMGVHCVLIKKSGEYLGMLTQTDIEQSFALETTTTGALMNYPIISIDVSDDVEEAKKVMEQHKINHLAVSRKNEIIGIFSTKDLPN